MAGRSRTDRKASKAKARKRSPSKTGKSTKPSRRTVRATNPLKHFSVLDLKQQLDRREEELNEAREQQAATAAILKVINASPDDLKPVFDMILEKAHTLCDVPCGSLQLFEEDQTRAVAVRGMTEPFEKFLRQGYQLDRSQPVQSVNPFQIKDLAKVIGGAGRGSALRVAFELGGVRTMLSVPLVRDGVVFGRIVAGRQEVRPFSEHQIAVLQSFADQAVIAIENVRLFEEVQQHTRHLAESLQQQTATAEVLKTISRSAFDLQKVLDSLLGSACQLCEADFGTIRYRDGGEFRLASAIGCKPEWIVRFASYATKPDRSSVFGRTILESAAVHIPDVLADPDFNRPEAQKLIGFRAALGVPMIREGQPFGVINLFRFAVGPFSEKQIELVQTFADQSVIAIENARLFNEIQEALEQQTATADILKVIASSPSDVQPVFEAIAERSKRLVDALSTTVFRLEGGVMHLSAFTSTNPEADATLKAMFPAPLSNFSWGQAISDGDIFRVVDTEQEVENLRELARLRGFRSMLFVPLLRDGAPIGLIAVTRVEPGPFLEHHVRLLQTFADQAVIAIENTRLFSEVQTRTMELSASLQELRAAQDRLVQTEKLASLGQLTAGIAHEIKNPLNFVNNFSALSTDLIDEMNSILFGINVEKGKRDELDEIMQMLKSNLEKVVQHGKRADSIVKNMLLHSRQGSGEHRSVDINVLVDESLNLAYHGARAEKTGFNIDLVRDFDPTVGSANVYAQEITRVLLNLISNGFYAAAKRKTETGNGFTAMVIAATKNLGDKVEIRIRDNGTGIPDEVKEKIFNPFFTTKPAGEGTGLGLSMSHDIIVKQHGGTIHVDTQPGVFTEFVITLPRATSAQKPAGRA